MVSLEWLMQPARKHALRAFRQKLQDDHERLVANLRAAHTHLSAVAPWTSDPRHQRLLVAYEALIALAERENFTAIHLERIPIVLAQVAERLARLDRVLCGLRRSTH